MADMLSASLVNPLNHVVDQTQLAVIKGYNTKLHSAL